METGLLLFPVFLFASHAVTMSTAASWPLINLIGTDKLREPLSYYATVTKEVGGNTTSANVQLKPGEDATEVVGPLSWEEGRHQ